VEWLTKELYSIYAVCSVKNVLNQTVTCRDIEKDPVYSSDTLGALQYPIYRTDDRMKLHFVIQYCTGYTWLK